jgi:hypothetical protein
VGTDVGEATAATLRMRWLNVSAMNRLPAASTATPWGNQILALVAGPPSPEKIALPVPATVVITPVAVATLRTRLFNVSAMNRLPAASNATPVGWLRLALVAGPPSPEKSSAPVLATVVMMPVVAATLRTRWL